MKTLHACLLGSALVVCLVPSAALAQLLCSPFDALPTSQVTAGGPLADVAACCDGEATDEGCGPCRCAECGDEAEERNIGRPVDTLSGFAWLERTDFNIASPVGPHMLFARTYSTHWAQSRGGSDEIGRLGPGWTDTYGARLVLDGNSPPQVVKYRKADTGTENFSRLVDGTYAARLPGRRLSFDGVTQRWVLEKFDASIEVFDATGRLVHLRAQDAGEAHLVYTGEDVACPVAAARPAGTLCRVDFLFGHTLWLRYSTTSYPGAPRLVSLAWDAAGTQVLAQFSYDTGGYLVTALQADGRQETYTYGFTHSFPRVPNQTVELLTNATDGDSAPVESFTYQQLTLAPSRVVAHETPEGRYTFSYGIDNAPLERSTTIRSSRQNLRLTWEGGKLKTVCHLDEAGQCDVTRMKEMAVPATGILAPTCKQDFSGDSTRYVRDSLGRRVSTLPGLADCNNPTAAELLHEAVTGYVANSNRRAYTSKASVDTSAPAGTTTFAVDDYTAPASAIDPLCGNASCQVPTAYNTPSSALTSQVQQRVRVGRTLASTTGTWETRVEVTRYSYDSSGLLVQEDGPLSGTADAIMYEYYNALGPLSSAGRLKKVLQGTRVLAEYADYTDRGQPREVKDGNGQTTLYTYDAAGRVLTVQGPDETQPTQYTYSPGGRLEQVQLPRGNRLLYTYDTTGRLTSVGQTSTSSGTPTAFDEEVLYEWGTTSADAGSLLRESYLREGTVVRTTTYGYDAQGRRATVNHLQVEDPLETDHASLRLTTFNEAGDVVATRVGTYTETVGEDLEPTTTLLYDNLQRLAEVQPTAQKFSYDWHDNITEVHEAFDPTNSGNTPRTFYRYDDFGRLVEVSSTTLGLRRHVYDVAGKRVQELQPNGDVLAHTYDVAGRQTATTGPGLSETYTYDTDAAATVLDCATGTALGASYGVGRLTRVEDASGTTYFGYTPGGNPRFEARQVPGATCARALHWEYDGNGQLAAMRYPSGARVLYEYPAANTAHMHVPSAVWLEVGSTTLPLATDLTWEAGALIRYTAGNGFTWHLTRWLDGTPSEWKVTRLAWGSDEEVIRRRAFGEDTGSALEPRMDGRGSPLLIEENDPSRTTGYTYQQVTGYLSSDTRNSSTQTYVYSGRWGDRSLRETGADPANGATDTSESYTYDTTTFRLTQAQDVNLSTSATTTRTYSYGPGGEVTEVSTDGRPLSLCYDSKAQVAAVVGPGGQYTRQVFNFRRQRVREEWPVNGLVTDYWVGTNGALLMEAGAASLTAQYPRPVWEYVYVGGQPVARVDSTETQGGTTSYQGSSFLFGGHLGELLLEADEAGHVVRSYDYTAFGARQARPTPTQPVGLTLSTGLPVVQVALPAPASVKLRFENFALAPCYSVAVLDEESHLLTRLSSSHPTSFETEVLPAQGSYLTLWLQQEGSCAGSSSLTLAEVKPTWGRAQQTLLTGHEYSNPSAGFFVSLSLPASTHLLVERSWCDTLQVRRTGTQEVLWNWPADSSFFNAAWTPALSGEVEVGISSTLGCGGFPRLFALRRMYTPLAPGVPANLHLPGQRALTAATSTRRGAFGDPEPYILENWHRTYQPDTGRYVQPEPMLQNPRHVRQIAFQGHSVPAFTYAWNNPLYWTDPSGLDVFNSSNRTIWVKPEWSRDSVPIKPGGAYIGEQDGIADPCRPGEVYKNSDLMDLQVLSDGAVVPYSPFVPMMIFQPFEGGWKNERWKQKLNSEGDHGWDELYEKSRSTCECN